MGLESILLLKKSDFTVFRAGSVYGKRPVFPLHRPRCAIPRFSSELLIGAANFKRHADSD
jgi:hypothetical protein